MESKISVNNLNFKYSEKEILKNISLEIQSGIFLSLIGPNGSGKTTLIKNLVKLLPASSGEIFIEDKNISNISFKEMARKIAFVHQDSNLNFDFTVEDLVLMGRFPYLKKFESESSKDYDLAHQAMLKTDVYKFKDRSIHSISGGELQRVMIAKALAQDTDILILDEPISSLDLKFQLSVLDTCKRLVKEEAITVICILHDINLAARYSDKILLLKDGEIYSLGKPKEVITKENIKEVYKVDVDIINLDQDKIPMIIPHINQSI